VAIVAIKDQQPIFALCTRCCVEIEMPNPIHAFFIGSPAIIGYCNTPIGREVALLIPVGEVILPGQDDEWWDSLSDNSALGNMHLEQQLC
jgi:hypothetical protein